METSGRKIHLRQSCECQGVHGVCSSSEKPLWNKVLQLALGYAMLHWEGTWRYSQILLGRNKKLSVCLK